MWLLRGVSKEQCPDPSYFCPSLRILPDVSGSMKFPYVSVAIAGYQRGCFPSDLQADGGKPRGMVRKKLPNEIPFPSIYIGFS